MVPVRNAIEGLLVEVRHLWVILVDLVVEDIIDPQLKFVFLEEGQHLLNG